MKNIFHLILLFLYYAISFSQHNSGKDCAQCHSNFRVGGTVFFDSLGKSVAKNISVSLIPAIGNTINLSNSNSSGNFYSTSASNGAYIIKVGSLKSKSWHTLPTKRGCNLCHIVGGNGSTARYRLMPKIHPQLPQDNSCTCHSAVSPREYSQLRTPGVLMYSTSTGIHVNNIYTAVNSFELSAPWPNPFNSTVNLSYNLTEPGYLNISIFNISGQKIATLVDKTFMEPVRQSLQWEVKNFSSGIYFVSAKNGTNIITKQILYLK